MNRNALFVASGSPVQDGGLGPKHCGFTGLGAGRPIWTGGAGVSKLTPPSPAGFIHQLGKAVLRPRCYGALLGAGRAAVGLASISRLGFGCRRERRRRPPTLTVTVRWLEVAVRQADVLPVARTVFAELQRPLRLVCGRQANSSPVPYGPAKPIVPKARFRQRFAEPGQHASPSGAVGTL